MKTTQITDKSNDTFINCNNPSQHSKFFTVKNSQVIKMNGVDNDVSAWYDQTRILDERKIEATSGN